MKIGSVYRRIDGRFPFDSPYGIYVGTVPSGFLRFVYEGKDMLVNGGDYEEIKIQDLTPIISDDALQIAEKMPDGLSGLITDYIDDVESGINYLEQQKQDYGYGKERLREKAKAIRALIEMEGKK
jgi:hypothetical protein